MTAKQRETYLKAGAIVGASLFVLDYLVITPAYDAWTAQGDRIADLQKKVTHGQQLLDREKTIHTHWDDMLHQNLPADLSAAETRAFQAIGRWVAASSISLSSLTPSPQWLDNADGNKTLECRATATGTQASLGRFIYEMETDKIPVNLEEYEITTRDEHGAQLTMTARFTFLGVNCVGSQGGGGAAMRTGLLLLFLALAARAGFGQTPQSYDTYRMVRTKNIFDPARLPMPTGAPVVRQTAAPPPKPSDYVALTGIMVTSDTAVAFFTGSRPDYDKVLTLNGDIAGAKLTKITPSAIEVDRGGKKITVAVGQTVPFDNSAPAAAPQPVAAPADTSSVSPLAPTNAVPAGMSDVMRRMMERRQQQLK